MGTHRLATLLKCRGISADSQITLIIGEVRKASVLDERMMNGV